MYGRADHFGLPERSAPRRDPGRGVPRPLLATLSQAGLALALSHPTHQIGANLTAVTHRPNSDGLIRPPGLSQDQIQRIILLPTIFNRCLDEM